MSDVINMIRLIVTQNSESAEWSKAAKKVPWQCFFPLSLLRNEFQYKSVVIVHRTMLAPRSSPLLRSASVFFVSLSIEAYVALYEKGFCFWDSSLTG